MNPDFIQMLISTVTLKVRDFIAFSLHAQFQIDTQ
jgi:hypothetical protein